MKKLIVFLFASSLIFAQIEQKPQTLHNGSLVTNLPNLPSTSILLSNSGSSLIPKFPEAHIGDQTIDMTNHIGLKYGYWSSAFILESSDVWTQNPPKEKDKQRNSMRFFAFDPNHPGQTEDADGYDAYIEMENGRVVMRTMTATGVEHIYFFKVETAMRMIEFIYDPSIDPDTKIPEDIKLEMREANKEGIKL